jgi:hypothetical protein
LTAAAESLYRQPLLLTRQFQQCVHLVICDRAIADVERLAVLITHLQTKID